MSARPRQGAAYRPPLLDTNQITKLVDAASELFRVTYDLERAHKQAVKAWLAEVLADIDLFGPCQHYAMWEEYSPTSVAESERP